MEPMKLGTIGLLVGRYLNLRLAAYLFNLTIVRSEPDVGHPAPCHPLYRVRSPDLTIEFLAAHK
jgi:hypothetical protein